MYLVKIYPYGVQEGLDNNIDLPDIYVDLLIKLTVQKVLQQNKEQVPAEIESAVNAGIQSINQMITFEMQHEAALKERRNLGKPQRPQYEGYQQ